MENQITLGELLAVPLIDLERITGWTFNRIWFEHKGPYKRERIRITSPSGKTVINISLKSIKLGPGVFKDFYKVKKVGADLPADYVLHLVEEVVTDGSK